MALEKEPISLTIGEQIERVLDGRKQKWVVEKLRERDNDISEVQFSNKKNGHEPFTEKELKDLSKILKAEFTIA